MLRIRSKKIRSAVNHAIEQLEPRKLLTTYGGPEAPSTYAYTQNIASAPLLANSNAIDSYIQNYYGGNGISGATAPNDYGVTVKPGDFDINNVHGNGGSSEMQSVPVHLFDTRTGALTQVVNVPFPVVNGQITVTVEGESFNQNSPPSGVPGNNSSITNISTAAESGTTVTLTATAALSSAVAVNAPVQVSGVTVAGYNGWFIISSVNTANNSFTYTDSTTGLSNSSGGYALTYSGQSSGQGRATIAAGTSGANESGGTVTITATAALSSYLVVNTPVLIAGVGVAGYNGTFVITSVDAATDSFTYTDTATGLANSGGGIATSEPVTADSKLIIYDEDNNILYELYHTSRPTEMWGLTNGVGYTTYNTNGYWYSGAVATGSNSSSVGGFTEIHLGAGAGDDYEYDNMTAAGTSYGLQLARPDELTSNGGPGIKHALYFELPKSAWLATESMFPAIKVAGTTGDTNPDAPYYGARVRLNPDVDLSGLSPAEQAIAIALENYGAYLSDTYGIGNNADISTAGWSVDTTNSTQLNWVDFPASGFTLPISDFQWVNLAPQVTGISESSGSAGNSVTITGNNFNYASPVTTLGTFNMTGPGFQQSTTSMATWSGTQITPTINITATELGRYVYSGDTGNFTVNLYNSSGGAPLASVVVNTTGVTAGGFSYTPIPANVGPVTLTAGQTYYLVSSETTSIHEWSVTPNTAMTIPGPVTGNGTTWTPTSAPNYEYGPVDMLCQIDENSTGLSVLFGGTAVAPNDAAITSHTNTSITVTVPNAPSGVSNVDVQVLAGVPFSSYGWRSNLEYPGYSQTPSSTNNSVYGYGFSPQYVPFSYGGSGSTEAAGPIEPPQVGNLSATPGNGSVNLSWSAPYGISNPAALSDPVTYSVYRGTIAGFEDYAYTATSATESGTTVTITMAALPPNVAVGRTVMVNGVSVSGYNGVFTVTGVGTNTFTYTDASGLANASGGKLTVPLVTGLTSPTYTDTTATNGTTYYYQVVTVDHINANPSNYGTIESQFYASFPSNEVLATPTSTPTAYVQDANFQLDSVAPIASGGDYVAGFSTGEWEQVSYSASTGNSYYYDPNWGGPGNMDTSTFTPADPDANHVGTVGGVWNPTTDTWPSGGNPFPNGGYSGTQVAWVDSPLYPGNPSNLNGISSYNTTSYNQIVQQTGITIAANTTYTLTVAVGARNDTKFGGYQIGLEYGSINPVTGVVTGTQLATPTTSGTAPLAGGFSNETFSFTTPASGSMIGQKLIVMLATDPANNTWTALSHSGTISTQDQPQTDFSNVQLTSAASSTDLDTGETLGSEQHNNTGWLGAEITIGSSNITVTGLGRWVISGNTQSHTLELVDATIGNPTSPLVSTTINTSGATPGQFLYASCAPTVLMAGHVYYLVSSEVNLGDWFYSQYSTTVTTTSAATVNSGTFWVSGTSWDFGGTTGEEYGPMDLQYTIAQDVTGKLPPPGSAIADLTQTELAPVVTQAIDAWAATDMFSSEQIAQLQTVQFEITDLPQGIAAETTGLGQAAGQVVYIDQTGGGYGWSLGNTVKRGRVDLLTVVAHELGHILGLPDVNNDTLYGGVMDTTLPVGVRHLPPPAAMTSFTPNDDAWIDGPWREKRVTNYFDNLDLFD